MGNIIDKEFIIPLLIIFISLSLIIFITYLNQKDKEEKEKEKSKEHFDPYDPYFKYQRPIKFVEKPKTQEQLEKEKYMITGGYFDDSIDDKQKFPVYSYMSDFNMEPSLVDTIQGKVVPIEDLTTPSQTYHNEMINTASPKNSTGENINEGINESTINIGSNNVEGKSMNEDKEPNLRELYKIILSNQKKIMEMEIANNVGNESKILIEEGAYGTTPLYSNKYE